MTEAAHRQLCGPCVWASLFPKIWCECCVHMYINAVSGQCRIEGIASRCKTAAGSRQNVRLSSSLFILVGSYSQLLLTPATLVPPWLGTSEPARHVLGVFTLQCADKIAPWFLAYVLTLFSEVFLEVPGNVSDSRFMPSGGLVHSCLLPHHS